MTFRKASSAPPLLGLEESGLDLCMTGASHEGLMRQYKQTDLCGGTNSVVKDSPNGVPVAAEKVPMNDMGRWFSGGKNSTSLLQLCLSHLLLILVFLSADRTGTGGSGCCFLPALSIGGGFRGQKAQARIKARAIFSSACRVRNDYRSRAAEKRNWS